MTKSIDLQDIIKKNPYVNLKKLQEGLELSKKIRALGIQKTGYRLASPAERRRVIVVGTKSERQIVRLRKLK